MIYRFHKFFFVRFAAKVEGQNQNTFKNLLRPPPTSAPKAFERAFITFEAFHTELSKIKLKFHQES
jgi:hypothetical protein